MISNLQQKVNRQKYDENFVKIFGDKKAQTGKYVLKDGKLVPERDEDLIGQPEWADKFSFAATNPNAIRRTVKIGGVNFVE